MKIKKGIELTLKIESLAFGGQGLARVNGHVVFVEGAIPGQEVIAKIFRKRKGYAEARAIEVVQESVYATDPCCRRRPERPLKTLQIITKWSTKKPILMDSCLRRND